VLAPPPLVLHRALPSPAPPNTPQGTGAKGNTPGRERKGKDVRGKEKSKR